MNRQPAGYILVNKRNGTLYIGVTSDLIKRVWEHRNNFVEGFTKKYGVHFLVWYELHGSMESADPARETIERLETKVENAFD